MPQMVYLSLSFIDYMYPYCITDESHLVPERRYLHGVLSLPLNRSLLRSFSSALRFPDSSPASSDLGGSSRLRNVHLLAYRLSVLKLPVIDALSAAAAGRHLVLIRGDYDYCHYLQDRFDDKVCVSLVPRLCIVIHFL